MARLSIRLLGPFQVTLDGQAATGFESDKVRALLAYLALAPDRPHRRETLAGLLWPEVPERSARASLRNALANLRQVIGDRYASPPFLDITHQTIQINRQSDHWLDAGAFEALLQSSKPGTGELEEAVGLYRGEFLEGFSIPDSPAFEEWALLTREQLQRQMLTAVRRLVDNYEKSGDLSGALELARQWVDTDPWQEDAQRQLMRLLALNEQRGAALAQYETWRHLLAEELGVEQSQLGIDVGLHRPGRHCGRKVIWHPEPPPSRLAASWAVDKVSAALPDCH